MSLYRASHPHWNTNRHTVQFPALALLSWVQLVCFLLSPLWHFVFSLLFPLHVDTLPVLSLSSAQCICVCVQITQCCIQPVSLTASQTETHEKLREHVCVCAPGREGLGGEDTWLEYWQNDFLLTVVCFWHLCLHYKHTRTCTHAHTALLCFRLSVKVPVSHSVMRLYTFSAYTHSCSSSHKQSQFNMLIWVTSLCHHSGHVWDFAWTNVPNYFLR